MERLFKLTRKAAALPLNIFRHGIQFGRCPMCGPTVFFAEGTWLRDCLRCSRCYSIPRWRALVHTLNLHVPDWRNAVIHESSPGGAASRYIRRSAPHYSASFYFPGTASGDRVGAHECQDIQGMSLAPNSVDIFITQDVLEHVPFPEKAFSEVARVLRPGGVHVFTVPFWKGRQTVVRATMVGSDLKHHLPADYHKDPISKRGALVFR